MTQPRDSTDFQTCGQSRSHKSRDRNLALSARFRALCRDGRGLPCG